MKVSEETISLWRNALSRDAGMWLISYQRNEDKGTNHPW